MCPIVHQARNIILGHLGQLLLKQAFEARQDDQTLPRPVIVHHAKLDSAIALFDDRRLDIG